MIPEPTLVNRLVALILLTSTSLFIGGVLFMAWRRIAYFRRDKGRSRRRDLGYIIARVGIIIIPGLIAYLVIPYLYIRPTWQTWLYIAGLILPTIGYAILAFTGEE